MSSNIQNQFAATGVARVIIRLKDTAPNGKAALSAALGGNFVSAATSPVAQIAANMVRHGDRNKSSAARMHVFANLGIMLGTVDKDGLKNLRANTNVAAVKGAPVISLIRPTKAGTTVSFPKDSMTWGIIALGINKLWDAGLTGKGVIVGHLDTGVDGRHKAFKKGAIREFQEFDDLGFAVTPRPDPRDSGDHGTHTAGTIAGRPVNGKHIGVAYGAELLSGMVIEGGEVVARLLAGMDWVVGSGARILNMSLGLRGYVEDFLDVTKVLREKGVLPVFAAGNEGTGYTRSPGNYAEALSVGAFGIEGSRKKVPDFSSSQRFSRAEGPVVPDCVAPGVDIISAMPGGGYQKMPGTSMATPHISGLAALLFEAKPTASVDDVENAILDSCKLPATMIGARAGRGIPNAARALKLLVG